jgi:hypothetical protein
MQPNKNNNYYKSNISDATNLIGTTSSSSFTQPATFKKKHHSSPYVTFSPKSPKIETFIVLKF